MSQIIGIITAWGCQDWIRPAIQQAIKYCDEVNVCVNAHSDNLLKFEDDTFSVVEEFSRDINIIEFNKQATHLEIKSKILNQCLEESRYFDIGNWVWILDADEFYDDTFCKKILKQLITNNPYDQICIKERYFYINMQHYLKSEHNRFFKINSLQDRFYPMQQWSGTTKVGYLSGDILFHYCMLLNPNLKLEQWKSEFPNTNQQNKLDWLEKIYRNYDLKNEEYWIKENEKLFGIRSPLINIAAIPNEDGKLFKYTGKHPEVIEESGLTKIKDFRKYYRF